MVDWFRWNVPVSHDCELIAHYLLIVYDRRCLCFRRFDWILFVYSICMHRVWLQQSACMYFNCSHYSIAVCLSVCLLIHLHSCVVYLILASVFNLWTRFLHSNALITQPKYRYNITFSCSHRFSTRLHFFIHSCIHCWCFCAMCNALQPPEIVKKKISLALAWASRAVFCDAKIMAPHLAMDMSANDSKKHEFRVLMPKKKFPIHEIKLSRFEMEIFSAPIITIENRICYSLNHLKMRISVFSLQLGWPLW